MLLIEIHLAAALLALALGAANLVLAKGNLRHRMCGWFWVAAMLGVTLPSFWIRDLNSGAFSWIHGLSLWTLFSMAMAIFAVRTRRIRLHANFMVGTMAGAAVAGLFALAPGRYVSRLLGYG